ncbi:suppressor of fused domain protein [Bacillus sp. NP157]|nr:suppressor of fused domain protein [Bacillus sp. NP157]
MTTVFEHLEAFAGEIVDGWKVGSDGTERPFQVVRTKGGPHAGTVTFSTLGLSRFQLPSGPERGHKHIRHELILVVPEDAIPFNVISLLQQVGMEAIEREQAYLRGEVIGPRGPMFEGCQPKALYVAIPVYFPTEFAVATTEESGDVVFAWLIPILDDEYHLYHTQGWSALEAMFVKDNPDLVDYRRAV